MIWLSIYIVCMLVLSIVLHELGHLFVITQIYKRKATFFKGKLRIGWEYDGSGLTHNQRAWIKFGGVFGGLIPIVILLDYGVFSSFGKFVIFSLYLAGSIGDVKGWLKGFRKQSANKSF